ncbi:MAG: apolipoprotein N-acyltransferase [Planctomycetota bacterium]|nr:MAG: apolipoprotein N-acyltransferase [Planctomycetota bacterium]
MSRTIETTTPKTRAGLALSGGVSVCAASAVSSLLTLLAFPPVGWWVLAFVAPMPLLWAASRMPAAGRRARLGVAVAATLGMVPMWAWQQQWVFGVSALGAVLLVIYLSMYAGAFVWLASWVAARFRAPVWMAGPVLWAGLEWFRGVVMFDGYPWLMAGHPLIESAALSRAGAVVGASGVSLLMLLVVGAVYGVVAARGVWRWRAAAGLVGVMAVWVVLAAVPRGAIETVGTMRVAVVQTNVPQGDKQGWTPPQRMVDLERMLELTERACDIEPRPDLVVWPETMFPGAALDPASIAEERAASLIWSTGPEVAWPELRFVVFTGMDGIDAPEPVPGPFEMGGRLVMPTTVPADSVLAWQRELGVPFLIGAEGYDGLRLDVDPDTGVVESAWDASFNSTYLLRDGRMVGERYDKMHLTPFGEVMPYISAWPWLERVSLRLGIGASGMTFNLDAGRTPVRHVVETEAGRVRVATPVCFEGVMPGVCRRLAYAAGERRADVLVQLTNEGWFGGFDAGRRQHLQIVRWRALELGTSVVRAANTGVSAVIDPYGGVLKTGVERGDPAGDTMVDGVLFGEVPLASGDTAYARIGDVAGWLGLVGAGIWVIAAGVLGRSERSQRPGTEETDKHGGGSAT